MENRKEDIVQFLSIFADRGAEIAIIVVDSDLNINEFVPILDSVGGFLDDWQNKNGLHFSEFLKEANWNDIDDVQIVSIEDAI